MVRYYRKIFLLVIIFFFNLPLAAQLNKGIAVLEKEFIEAETTQKKVTILNKLAYQYCSVNPSKALEYTDKSIFLSRKAGLKEKMMDAYYLKGIGLEKVNDITKGIQNATELIFLGKQYRNNLFIGQGYYLLGNIQAKISKETKAMQNYQQAFQHFKKANSKKHMANVYFRIANGYIYLFNYKEAVTYNLKAIQLFKEAKDSEAETVAINNLGDVYMAMKDYGMAKKYYLQSFSISEKVHKDDKSFLADDFVSLATVYIAMDSIDKAHFYYSKALAIFKKASCIDGIVSVNNSIGLIFMKKKEYAKALPYFNDAIKMSQEYGINHELSENLKNLGNLYLAQNKFKLSKNYFKKSLALALKIRNRPLQLELYNCLSLYYKAIANFRQSMVYLEKYYDLKETMLSESQRKRVTGLQIQYDTKEKEKEIQLFNQQNQIHLLNIVKQENSEKLFVIILIMLLVILAILLWLFISKDKSNMVLLEKNEEINIKNTFLENTQEKLQLSVGEKDVLLKEIHHRVKNNLQLVNSLLSIQARDSENKMNVKEFLYKSRDRVQSMALIHETLYMSNNIAEVDFQNYLEKLIRYLCSSFAIDNEIIKVNIDANTITLDIEKVIPLGLILTELINNAIKHAFPGGEGVITITLLPKNYKFLQLHFYDNGIGLPADYGHKETLGMRLIRDLVRQLEGHLEIEKTCQGSSFIIYFPK